MSAENVFLVPGREPRAILHVPGLRQAESGHLRDPKWSKWPYYTQDETALSKKDDVVAVAVLMQEILLADDYCREVWPELVSNHEREHGDPVKLLAREVTRFQQGHHEQVAPIVQVIDSIVKGTTTTIEPVLEAVR